MALVYSTGTVTATSGSGAITFSGSFITPDKGKEGDEIFIGGTYVGAIESFDYTAQSAVIAPVYSGSTGAGKTFAIRRASAIAVSASEVLENTVRLMTEISSFSADGINLAYFFGGDGTNVDPGLRLLKTNNATLSSVTELYVSETDGKERMIAPLLAQLVSDTIIIIRSVATSAFVAYKITAIQDLTNYYRFTVTFIGSDGLLSLNEQLSVSYDRPGAVTTAASVTFTPAGGVAATNVQDAIVELDVEKAPQSTTYTKVETDGLVATAAAGVGKRTTTRVATTTNITIATALNSGDAIDGVTLANGDLVLVKNQSAPEQNGIYVVGVTPVRSSEFDTYDEHPGVLIVVQEGSTLADTVWMCTSNTGGTLNTTGLVFTQLTIALVDGTVTNAKLANMATATFKGRNTAGTGSPEDLSVATARTMLSINNVDNTSDTNKPLSTAATTALNGKEAKGTFAGIATKTAAYTFALADVGWLIRGNHATGINFTIPLNSVTAFPVGTWINISQIGAGPVTIVPTGGVTLNSFSGATKTGGQHTGCMLYKEATDTWTLSGNITT